MIPDEQLDNLKKKISSSEDHFDSSTDEIYYQLKEIIKNLNLTGFKESRYLSITNTKLIKFKEADFEQLKNLRFHIEKYNKKQSERLLDFENFLNENNSQISQADLMKNFADLLEQEVFVLKLDPRFVVLSDNVEFYSANFVHEIKKVFYTISSMIPLSNHLIFFVEKDLSNNEKLKVKIITNYDYDLIKQNLKSFHLNEKSEISDISFSDFSPLSDEERKQLVFDSIINCINFISQTEEFCIEKNINFDIDDMFYTFTRVLSDLSIDKKYAAWLAMLLENKETYDKFKSIDYLDYVSLFSMCKDLKVFDFIKTLDLSLLEKLYESLVSFMSTDDVSMNLNNFYFETTISDLNIFFDKVLNNEFSFVEEKERKIISDFMSNVRNLLQLKDYSTLRRLLSLYFIKIKDLNNDSFVGRLIEIISEISDQFFKKEEIKSEISTSLNRVLANQSSKILLNFLETKFGKSKKLGEFARTQQGKAILEGSLGLLLSKSEKLEPVAKELRISSMHELQKMILQPILDSLSNVEQQEVVKQENINQIVKTQHE